MIDCSQYKLRIEQALTYVQVILNTKQTFVEHNVVIITVILIITTLILSITALSTYCLVSESTEVYSNL